MESPNNRARILRACPDMAELSIYDAVLDQVLSMDTFEIINWTKVADRIGYTGPGAHILAKRYFLDKWIARNGATSVEREPRGALSKHAHLLLAMLDDLSGRLDRPRGKWTRLALQLGNKTECAPRKLFGLLWQKYLRITRPEACIPATKTRGQKMDEWIADMQSYDDGDDDEEPLPSYEEYDSRESSTKSQVESMDSDSEIEVSSVVVAD